MRLMSRFIIICTDWQTVFDIQTKYKDYLKAGADYPWNHG